MRAHHIEDALTLLKENAEFYANSANVYDSLGEAYAEHGDKALAIANYRKALALGPANANAVAKLKQLEGEK